MQLIFIYGPPAVGKLSVANALAKLTGYRVFHNHLTIDLVRSIFDWGQGPFFSLVDRYRVELIEAAAKANIPGVIFTFVYAKDQDDGFNLVIDNTRLSPRKAAQMIASHYALPCQAGDRRRKRR
ncbi:MAG TPA: AAA family ATPase [bacterium]|nr:AAA family ATPase [bacterium]